MAYFSTKESLRGALLVGACFLAISGCGFVSIEAIDSGAVAADSGQVEADALVVADSGQVGVDTLVARDGFDARPSPRAVSALEAGDYHTCLIYGGELYCFGANSRFELGVGDATNRSEATRVGVHGDWTALSAGANHSCAIRAGGSVWCWGENEYGQLGVGDLVARDSPSEVPLPSPAREVTAGGNHSCALLDDGQIACWGRSLEGCNALGDSFDANDVLSPTLVPDASGWTAVFAGQGHTLAVNDAGTWGSGRDTGNQLGLGEGSPTQRRSFTEITTIVPSALAAGQDGSCVVLPPGTLQCWGDNDSGALGMGDMLPRTTPTRSGTDADWRLIAMNFWATCGLRADGVYCVGRGVEGQLGSGRFEDSLTWIHTLERPADAVEYITMGRNHSCVLTNGEALCTGDNSAGQLGRPDLMRRNTWESVLLP